MRKLFAIVLLSLVLPVAAMAADVQSMVEELPSVSDFEKMDTEQQKQIYEKLQSAYDAYLELSEEEKAEVENAEQTFHGLFSSVNARIMPLEVPEETEEEPDAGSNLLATVIAAMIGLLLARKLVTKRKIG